MNTELEIKKLQKEIEAIKLRNARVEKDKAWEVSRTRTVFIASSTYALILIFMFLLNDKQPFLNALVASLSYLLSTFTYDILKKWWLQKNSNN